MSARRLAGVLLGLLAAPAAALVVDAPQPSRVEGPPPTDPGWRHVGAREARTAVYLGDAWVLTAGHVGPGTVRLEGIDFPAVPGSAVVLDSPRRLGVPSDLVLFRVEPEPGLPRLEVRKRPPPEGTQVLLMGHGQGRGERVVWSGLSGFRWLPGVVKRWGTNRIAAGRSALPGPGGTSTLCFRTDFEARGSPFEAQATVGDSGGAVFARGREAWKLAGIMIAVTAPDGQPGRHSFYGNSTHAADLALYYDQIASITGRDDALPRPGQAGAKQAGDTPARAAGDATPE